MSDTLSTIILGIIEGITEFLPISSTGHLLIAEQWLGERSELFNVAIQAAAILAIVLIYWRRLVNLLTRLDDPASRDYLAKLVVAFLITAVGGFIATRLGWKLPDQRRCRSPAALLIGGIAILLIERLRRHAARWPRRSRGRWRFWVGACQILAAVFPGTSRSAATIFAAMLVGLTLAPGGHRVRLPGRHPDHVRRHRLRVPQAARHERRRGLARARRRLRGVGVVAFIAVKWLLRYVQTHRFTVFAWYRIALGAALIAADDGGDALRGAHAAAAPLRRFAPGRPRPSAW